MSGSSEKSHKKAARKAKKEMNKEKKKKEGAENPNSGCINFELYFNDKISV